MLSGFPGPPAYGAPSPGQPGASGPPPPPPPGPSVGPYGSAGYRPPGPPAPKPPGPYGVQQQQQHNGHRKPEPPAGFRSVPPGGKPAGGPSQHSQHHHRSSSQQHHPPSSAGGSSNSSSVIPMAVENRLRRDTPFLAHIRFKNDLPEIPSDPKMLVSQIQPEVLSRFALTALERQARRDLLTPPNIIISPLDVQRYQVPDQPGPMDPADAALLKEDSRPLAGVGGSQLPGGAAAIANDGRHKSFAARTKGMDVDKCSWLMRTTYISSSDNRGIQKQGLPEKQVLQARAAERRGAAGAGGADDRELNDVAAQARAIEASFEAARLPPVHSRNPALRPVEVLPVLPDMDAWPQKLLLTTFYDSDPAEEVAAVVGPEAVAGLPAAKRPQLLVGHYLLKGFTHRVNKVGQDRELKIMALLVREDIEDMVARTAAQAARQAELQAAGEEGREVAEAEAPQGLQPEDMEGAYQWIKDYNYEYKRDSVHYAIRLEKGSARFYRMQGKLELRSWRDEEKLARERGRKRGMGRAGSEEPAEEDADGADQVQRPSKIRVTTRDYTDRELQEREAKQRELLPAE
ncbi:hypothetical protein PLESTB_001475900 [Pleodorina starrii]|uniref:Uncharacterized protein n=1 Tax=Pleodorina starrii TaxID=330485 RepID=A0A9W6F7N0_9CHLO|nr:hypothetical protein PLESTM_000647300 [Pleodorina starrii]GLC59339.1 hypothetical protein PLESTB_001475900 [Pleodorina starrii]GLC74462.1 hypothetical protein PLESTF_001515400 [Pleodorina starrii]